MDDRYVVLLDRDRDAHPRVITVRAVRARLRDAKQVRQVGGALWILPGEDYDVSRRTSQRYVHVRDGTVHDGGVFKLERR